MIMNKVIYNAITQSYAGKVLNIVSNIIIEYNGAKVKTVALWDTGAMNSVISEDVVKQLKMIPTHGKGKRKI